jgi:predicted Rossmann fold nucleotide-binding protein DprA/Smf involved in DNA uptake
VTKLEALSFAIEDANSLLKNVLGNDEEKYAQEMVKALNELEDDIIQFLDTKITASELYKRLVKEKGMKLQQTQGERVQKLVARKAKSVKQLATETGFLEPNIRRILGQGEKKGIFKRVEKGVYILNKKNE